MKRVGIITMYHNSENYGGILQAYALTKKMSLLGADAKQISFDTRNQKIFAKKKTIKTVIKSKIAKWLKLLSLSGITKRKVIQKFRDGIPHTHTVNSDNIAGILDDFDVFITGSDQVWNPSAVCYEYLLSFVPPEKTKLSYAASISRDSLTEAEQQVFKKYLSSFTGISVRESQDVRLLEPCIDQEIKWVLDPVFLLDKQEWEQVACERLIKENYIFCYFLNDKNKNPEVIADFAKQAGAVTVQIDGLGMRSVKIADQVVKNVGPKEFLSLIQHAQYVLTDSFHAMSFSFLFQKNFMVFPRNKERGMETRITSFLHLIGRNDLFLDTKTENTDTLLSVQPMDYRSEYTDLEQKRLYSTEFLKKYL